VPLYFVMSAGRNLPGPTSTSPAIAREREPAAISPASAAWRTLVFDDVLDAILMADDDRRIIDANAAACALLGTSRSTLVGKRIEDSVQTSPGYDPIAAWNRFIAKGHDSGEFPLARPDGSRLTLEYRARANVAPGVHVSILRDATARITIGQRLVDSGARAERLQEMAAKLVEATSVSEIFDLVVKGGVEHLGIRRAWMGMLDRNAAALVNIRYAGPDGGGIRAFETIPLSAPLPIALAVREERSFYVETREECLARWPAAGELSLPGESLAIAATPLVVRKVAIGAIMLSYGEPHEFDEAERAFVQAIAQLCAAAIDREAANRTLHDSERAHRFLADAGVALAQSLDEVETLRNVAELAIGSFADWCWVDMRDPKSGDLVRVAVAGPSRSRPALAESIHDVHDTITPDPGYPALRALRDGEPVLVRDFDATAWQSAISADERLASEPAPHSVMAVPLRARGENFGALTLARNDASQPYDERDLQFATEVGRRASVAIENARLYATARRDRAAAEEASRAKDQFLAVLGHELRNPLAPIATALRLMALRAGDACISERAIIERQVQHMTRLVDDLLDVSRITRGKVELRRRPVEIADVIAKAVEIASPALEQKQHRLEVDTPTSGLAVNGDAGRLAQVFANLLTNSAKYTPPYGDVYVRATRDKKTVRVSVRDTGTGIAPEVLPHIFEVFVQGARRDAVRAGLGLGLAIVRSLTELHGGRVEASSDGPNLGSEFVVELPLFETAEREAARPTPRDRPSPVGRPLRVLVVDDNIDAAEMLAEWFVAIGHRVQVATDGPTALERAADFKPQVALLDIGLPVMDGYEVARRLRELPGCAATRLIALTGYGQESDHERSRRAGFEDHLVKPVDLEAITHAVSTPRSQ
jgi:PAS domain S-box-containing protein